MSDFIIKELSIDDRIKELRKAIEHERKLYFKHSSKSAELSRELVSLLNQRKTIFPYQYTKHGNLRKAYKDKF